MDDTKPKELTPEEVLMNCLAETERIKEIVILTFNKDGYYETWSNGLPTHVRLGLLEEAVVRAKKSMADAVGESID